MIPKDKDCRLHKFSKDFWEYFIQCACCGQEGSFFIVKYPSGRYWVVNQMEERVAWGNTLAVAKRKARERVARGKELKDAYLAKIRKEQLEWSKTNR